MARGSRDHWSLAHPQGSVYLLHADKLRCVYEKGWAEGTQSCTVPMFALSPFLGWAGQSVGTPISGDQSRLRAGDAHLVLITASHCPWPWRLAPFLSDGSFRDGTYHLFGTWRYHEQVRICTLL